MVEYIDGHNGIEVHQQIVQETKLSIIAKIRKGRNRACVQNIHNIINRRGINIRVIW